MPTMHTCNECSTLFYDAEDVCCPICGSTWITTDKIDMELLRREVEALDSLEVSITGEYFPRDYTSI